MIFSPVNFSHAEEVPPPAEQVVVSPAQAAVNTAIATATTEVDDVRITKGIARYTAGFTPSAVPFTNDSYTKLLLNFDGTNDSILLNTNLLPNTSELTYELWIKPTALTGILLAHSNWSNGYVHFQFHCCLDVHWPFQHLTNFRVGHCFHLHCRFVQWGCL